MYAVVSVIMSGMLYQHNYYKDMGAENVELRRLIQVFEKRSSNSSTK